MKRSTDSWNFSSGVERKRIIFQLSPRLLNADESFCPRYSDRMKEESDKLDELDLDDLEVVMTCGCIIT